MTRIVLVDWSLRAREESRVVVLEKRYGFGWQAIASKKATSFSGIACAAAELATKYNARPMVELGIGDTPGKAIAYELELLLGPDWSPWPEPRIRNL